MKCVICHGEDIQFKEVREEISVGNDIVFVPAKTFVCLSCGERYFDRRTMKYLEEVEDRVKQGSSKLVEIGRILAYR